MQRCLGLMHRVSLAVARWRCRPAAATARRPSRGRPDAEATPAGKGTIGVSVLTLTNPFFKVIGDTITEEARKRGYDVDRHQRRIRRGPAAEPGEGLHRQEGRGHRALPVRLAVDRPGHPGGRRGRDPGLHGRHRLPRAGGQGRLAHRHRQLRRRQAGGRGDDRGPGRGRRQGGDPRLQAGRVVPDAGQGVQGGHRGAQRGRARPAGSRSSPSCPATARRTRATSAPRTPSRPTPTSPASSRSTTPRPWAPGPPWRRPARPTR